MGDQLKDSLTLSVLYIVVMFERAQMDPKIDHHDGGQTGNYTTTYGCIISRWEGAWGRDPGKRRTKQT